jgi:hypothetical protein
VIVPLNSMGEVYTHNREWAALEIS